MKVLSIIGEAGTGKTTTVENIIKELRRRRYKVGFVKEIDSEKFIADIEGLDISEYEKAGSQLITLRGTCKTGILFRGKISMDELLRFYDHDFVILENITDVNAPRIITAIDEEGIDNKYDDLVFCISGIISGVRDEYNGLPIISPIDNIKKLVDLIEEKVYDRLPDFSIECCDACGFGCRGLGSKILKGEARREDCKILNTKVKLFVNDDEIQIVPFVKNILSNAVLGVVKELEGYKEGKEIKVIINSDSDPSIT
ncbi:MAG TPA: molybdopterin-guanine dinucleotide biosynthesis protein MobB [Clostridia bacterium]|nr:molybdopterin-guanine dinucleotide biosynthesis protein MobB [Clostridia bacterium]